MQFVSGKHTKIGFQTGNAKCRKREKPGECGQKV